MRFQLGNVKLIFLEMHPKIFAPNIIDEFYTEEKCHILEIINAPEVPAFSLAQARVEPGVTTAWHSVKETDEVYYILEGTGEMEIGTSFKKPLKKGEAVFIPKNQKQRITNTGDGDLVFLCVCTPRFLPENYEEA